MTKVTQASIAEAKRVSQIRRFKDLTSTIFKSLKETHTLVDETEWERRLALCFECPQSEYLLMGLKCKLCGCFLNAKTRFSAATCPVKKW